MNSIQEQIQRNSVALISLVIAVTSLTYTGWRHETSEQQRSVRFAAFRVLEELGELQEVVLYRAYYVPPDIGSIEEGRMRVNGYGNVLLIRDLMNVMPDPGPGEAQKLETLWQKQVNALSSGANSDAAIAASEVLSAAIDDAREAVGLILSRLD